MSEQLDRAARELWRLTPQPERDFRAALRACQDLREWRPEELDALPDDALLVDSDLRVMAAWEWAERAKLAPPLRPLFGVHPDDLKEES